MYISSIFQVQLWILSLPLSLSLSLDRAISHKAILTSIFSPELSFLSYSPCLSIYLSFTYASSLLYGLPLLFLIIDYAHFPSATLIIISEAWEINLYMQWMNPHAYYLYVVFLFNPKNVWSMARMTQSSFMLSRGFDRN